MSGYKSFLSLVFILSLAVLILGVPYSEAGLRPAYLRLVESGYQKVSPRPDPSPKPDVVKDREFIDRNQTDAQSQPRLSEEPTTEEELTKEKPTHVGSEPSKIYYQISVNDVLFIAVWRVRDLSLEFIVGPDGKISFPLIGDINAAGRTLADVDAEITEKLKEYVVDPQVSVMVRKFAGDKLTVIGEIKSPGIYKFVGKTNILDVVVLAGGFTDRAKSASLVIVREPDNLDEDTNLIVVDIKSILKGNLSNNIEVQPNDIIYVSRTLISNVKEFYDNWITPIIDTVLDYESYKSIRRTRHQ